MIEGTSRIPRSPQIQPTVSRSRVPEADPVFPMASDIDDALLRHLCVYRDKIFLFHRDLIFGQLNNFRQTKPRQRPAFDILMLLPVTAENAVTSY